VLTNSLIPQNDLDVSRSWCAIYTRHQHEKVIAQILSAKGLEVFLPLYNTTRFAAHDGEIGGEGLCFT
jgi:hypothetical protein